MKIRELTNHGVISALSFGKLLVEPGTLFTQKGKPFAVSVRRVMPGGIGLKRRHGGSAGDTRPSSGYPRTFSDEVTGGTVSKVNAQRRTSGRRMQHFSKSRVSWTGRIVGDQLLVTSYQPIARVPPQRYDHE